MDLDLYNMTFGQLISVKNKYYFDLWQVYPILIDTVSNPDFGEGIGSNPSFIKDENIREELLTLFASIYDELDFEAKYDLFDFVERHDEINNDLHFVKSLYSTLDNKNLSDKTKLTMIKSIVQRRMQNKNE